MKITGLDELVDAAHKAGGELPGLLYNTMVRATTIVQEDAKRIGPGRFKNQTGNLRRSIFRRVESPARGVVGTDEKYGAYVEFGTQPHTITPKHGKYLKFKTDSGKVVFARSVRHPGSKPYPFMEPAFRNNTENILREYARVGDIIIRTMAR